MTLFGGYCDDSVSAGIWVIHSGPKSGGEPVRLFDRSRCELVTFLTVAVMIV